MSKTNFQWHRIIERYPNVTKDLCYVKLDTNDPHYESNRGAVMDQIMDGHAAAPDFIKLDWGIVDEGEIPSYAKVFEGGYIVTVKRGSGDDRLPPSPELEIRNDRVEGFLGPNPDRPSPYDDFDKFFSFGHLPDGDLKDTSAMIAEVYERLKATLPMNRETVAGLRKLLEAKDCFVRSHLLEK